MQQATQKELFNYERYYNNLESQMALRWRKNPRQKGPRAVFASVRGSKLFDGAKQYASINPLGGDFRGPVRGWSFVCSTDAVGEYANTCNKPAPDEETAKKQAMEFVKAKLMFNAKLNIKVEK